MEELEESQGSDYRVELEFFEGPLDLLLHLVKKHELDVFDIPVSFIAEKYLEYLDLMRSLNLDVAGEFILMAATLAHIKSREMLPRDPDAREEEDLDGEGTDPKSVLIRKLLEYQKFKEAAEDLGGLPQLARSVWTRPEGAEEEQAPEAPPPLGDVGLFELLETFSAIVARAKPELTHDVVVDRISLASRINELADVFRAQPNTTFRDCLEGYLKDLPKTPQTVRIQLVVTLLAILEMARLRMIRVRQATPGGEIYIELAAPDESLSAEELKRLEIDDSYE